MLFIILFTLIVIYVVHFYWKVSKYPKGPLPIPFFGNLLQFPKENFHEYIDDLSKIYGPCFTVYMPRPTVVLADYEHVKDAFITQGDTFTYRSHRPPESLFQVHHNTGVVASDGENWRLQRRTALRILREFGLGKGLMEEQVKRSVEEMLEQIEQIEDKKNVELYWPIQLCVGNVINETLFGYHYSYKNMERFEKFVNIVNDHMKLIMNKSALLMACFPWLRHFPIVGEIGYHRIKRNIVTYQQFIEEEVNAQVKVFNEDDEPTNFVHAYMQQMKPGSGLDMPNLYATSLDFWLGGMETTSNSLRWHIAYMTKYPEIQQKVREEILSVVGTTRLPAMSDKPNLPYTQAVINEVQRHSNMVPFLGSHQCNEDTVICGKPVPAGTLVFAQLWSIMANDPVFDSPLRFNPSRYLLDDQKTLNKAVLERTIPFSVGKRACVGEGLARMELLLIFAALIQKYTFVASGPLNMVPQPSAVLACSPYKYQQFIEDEVNAQAKLFNEDDEPTNFVHAYMQQMKPGSGLDMKNLYATAIDFWLAGMETTSNSLRWHIAYMMKYPEIQQKVREEVLSVVGTTRLPAMSDKPNLPYTQAVINEVQRHSNMIPFLGTHKCIEDTSVCGTKIPTDTLVFAQIWSVLANDPVFDSPLQFNPSRYLLEDQKTMNKAVLERTIPFSVGKRACVGEGLARMELLLIFAALLQKYTFIPSGPLDLTPQSSAVVTCPPYRVNLVENY